MNSIPPPPSSYPPIPSTKTMSLDYKTICTIEPNCIGGLFFISDLSEISKKKTFFYFYDFGF